MRIPCPLCGDRDISEFVVKGDADLAQRPLDGANHTYLHLRRNPAGLHRELMFHDAGCGAWLVVTRDTVTHDVISATELEDRAQ